MVLSITYSLSLKILDERAGRPTGNPFEIRTVYEQKITGFVKEVRTGLAIGLAQDMSFEITSTHPSIHVLGYHIDTNGELVVLVLCKSKTIQSGSKEPVVFAKVTIVEQSVKPVRFIEMRDGKRVIVGGPEEVKTDG